MVPLGSVERLATIDTHEWITIASCAGHLSLATIALRRLSKSPLALPLALLCLDLFVISAADVAFHLTGAQQWQWLDVSCASLMVPLAVRFVLAFVGRSRALAWMSRAFALYFGLIALGCAAAFLGFDWARTLASPEIFARVVAPGAVAAIVALGYLFVSHLGATHSPLERARTWLVISGIAVGTAGNTCDLLANAGFDVYRLGPSSLLITTLVLTVAALRVGLFERRISWLIAANGLMLGGLQVTGYFAVFYLFGGNTALLTIGIGALTLALVPALVAMTRAAAVRRQRLEYHATLGRFSAQMAHDLRNPLAAIKGAAQYLKEEQARGNPLADAGDFLTLIVDQADRLDRVVAGYQRIGRIETALAPIELDAMVGQVLGGQALAAPPQITLERKLGALGSKCQADPDLLSAALENLVRNAFEAMPKGGVVTVQTEVEDGFLRLAVTDTGKGMDPRLVERAFADFFTTKTTGSGLGLPFVRRVAEAHGGDASLKSEEGKGTTVCVRIPISGV
ncbi:MAG: two-component sensor histidine kinase [Myxococcaceae bacterium]|nr:two-component sensor histidine kinase [Myxococcaceae bacterium]